MKFIVIKILVIVLFVYILTWGYQVLLIPWDPGLLDTALRKRPRRYVRVRENLIFFNSINFNFISVQIPEKLLGGAILKMNILQMKNV